MENRRILVIGPSHEGSLPRSYARAFERLGMKVFHFDDERALFESGRWAKNRILRRALRGRLWKQMNEATLKVADEFRPALVFAVRASYLEAETVSRMREGLGAAVMNYYPDNPYIGVPLDPRKPSTQRRDLIEVLKQYSTVWMWEESLLRRLRGEGVEGEFLPFGVDPEQFRPEGKGEPFFCEACGCEHAVVFVGTCTAARLKEIESIRKHPVAIWGNGWPKAWGWGSGHRVHPPVYGRKLARIYGAAPVALNVLNAESLEGHNMRTFEVPASGGVMLARYTKAQAQFFPEREAAVYYKSASDIDAKIEELLADAALRARIRREAVRLAAAHTYDLRAAEILQHAGLMDRENAVNFGIAATTK
jgi:spore maturation protein CgeB